MSSVRVSSNKSSASASSNTNPSRRTPRFPLATTAGGSADFSEARHSASRVQVRTVSQVKGNSRSSFFGQSGHRGDSNSSLDVVTGSGISRQSSVLTGSGGHAGRESADRVGARGGGSVVVGAGAGVGGSKTETTAQALARRFSMSSNFATNLGAARRSDSTTSLLRKVSHASIIPFSSNTSENKKGHHLHRPSMANMTEFLFGKDDSLSASAFPESTPLPKTVRRGSVQVVADEVTDLVQKRVRSLKLKGMVGGRSPSMSVLTERIPIHPITLIFANDNFEIQFEEYRADKYLWKFKYCIVLFGISSLLVLIFGLTSAETSVQVGSDIAVTLSMHFLLLAYLAMGYTFADTLVQNVFLHVSYMYSPIFSILAYMAAYRTLTFADAALIIIVCWGIPVLSGIPAIVSGVFNFLLSLTFLVLCATTGSDASIGELVVSSNATLMATPSQGLTAYEATIYMIANFIICYMVAYSIELDQRRDFKLTKRLFAENVQVVMEMEKLDLFGNLPGQDKAAFSKSSVIRAEDLQVDEVIGSGGYGDVCKGKSQGATVAVKRLRGGLSEEQISTFKAEASIMADIRHPNVVMFLGFCPLPPMLVMEFMWQGSVRSILSNENQKLRSRLYLRFLVDSAKGMVSLHHHDPPVIHCDLKSLNLLVTESWVVKVSDFGLSSIQSLSLSEGDASRLQRVTTPEDGLGSGEDDLESGSSRLDEGDGDMVGSLIWCAPEILLGNRPTMASDVYAFGVIMFEVLTLKTPFADMNANAIPMAVTDGARPSDDLDDSVMMRDNCLSKLIPLMELCWHQVPAQRPNFTEILKILSDTGATEFNSASWFEKVRVPSTRMQMSAESKREARTKSGFMSTSSRSSRSQKITFAITEDQLVLGPKIGHGGYGDVFEAKYLGTHVAVKKLHAVQLTDKVLLDFKQECSIMKKLRHPNLVLFMGSCNAAPTLFLVTELMTRGSVFGLIKIDPDRPGSIGILPHLNFVCRLSADIARGMAYLHGQSPLILHRDLKSPNVMFDDNWVGKVGDFGLSRIVEEGKTMTKCGSPLWVAPEVLLGKKFGEAADVYSFAIIVWEALEWKEPHKRLKSMEIMRGVAKHSLRPPFVSGVERPQSMVQLIKHCWNQDQQKRPSFQGIIRALEKIETILERASKASVAILEKEVLHRQKEQRNKRLEYEKHNIHNNHDQNAHRHGNGGHGGHRPSPLSKAQPKRAFHKSSDLSQKKMQSNGEKSTKSEDGAEQAKEGDLEMGSTV